MKICIITPRFALAGVPLAQVRFAQAFAKRGYEVTLLIGYVEPYCRVPDIDGVNVNILNIKAVKSMFWPLVRYIHGCKPEIIFSAEDHLNVIVLLAAILSGSTAKISGSSRVTPFDTYSNIPLTKRWILKQLMRAVMWRADALTCVSKDMVEQYKLIFNSPPHIDVYNIVKDGNSDKKMKELVDHDWFISKNCPIVVAAGRLASWKGFTDLIFAIKELSIKRSIRLVILGDGPQRSELESLLTNLGLSEIVCLLGYVENPLKYFAHADVFVLSSHVEGLPNVLVEAMMCGCTPVSTDCPTGPREVLQGGKYGYLVPVANPTALAKGIEQALDNPIPKGVLKEAVLPFAEHAVIARHFEVLNIPLN